MTSACRCFAVVPLLVLALLLLEATSPCGAASGPPPTVSYDQGTEVFRRLLFALRFQPLHNFTELRNCPRESLVIVLGDPACLEKFPVFNELPSLVKQGAAVLIATDMKTEGKAGAMLNKLAGVTVTGETLVARRHHALNKNDLSIRYHSRYCPYVEPLENSSALGTMATLVGAGGQPDLFRRHLHPNQPRLQVATNAPSRLELSGWLLPAGIQRLAKLPQICQDENTRGPNFVDEKGPLFAVGGTMGKGRVLVLADHSIFINRMILPTDNSNLEFAANCLHWLRGGVSTSMEAFHAVNARSHAKGGNVTEAFRQLAGQRNKVLFWEDGVIRSNFEVPLKTTPLSPLLPPESALVAAIDKTIAKLEDSDSFNRALLEKMDGLPGGRESVVRSAVYLLTLAALLFLGYRFLWRTRHRPEFAAPSLTNALRKHEPRVSLLDQRRRALLRLGNVWEMGHRLARECFESAGVALTGASPPRVVMAQGGRWQRWRFNRRIARLWRLARGNAPTPISPAALQHWMRELAELETALAKGTIELRN